MTTLFAHIIAMHSHPENVATEALSFILGESQVARRALVQVLNSVADGFTSELSFATQVRSDDGGRPNIVGSDSRGRSMLVIEAKFWAGLTDRQPVAYVQSLPADGLAAL